MDFEKSGMILPPVRSAIVASASVVHFLPTSWLSRLLLYIVSQAGSLPSLDFQNSLSRGAVRLLPCAVVFYL